MTTDKITGELLVGRDDYGQVVINLDAETVAGFSLEDGGYIVFSPNQARNLAALLLKHADSEQPPPADARGDGDERERFERWAATSERYDGFERDPDNPDEYQDDPTHDAWRGWQARSTPEASAALLLAKDALAALASPVLFVQGKIHMDALKLLDLEFKARRKYARQALAAIGKLMPERGCGGKESDG